jgi:hypothetical protein
MARASGAPGDLDAPLASADFRGRGHGVGSSAETWFLRTNGVAAGQLASSFACSSASRWR